MRQVTRAATLNPVTSSVTIHVPGPLRAYCDGAARLELPASTVRAALEEIERRYPSLYGGVCDETGAVRRHVNLFVNSANVRDREGLETAMAPGDALSDSVAVGDGLLQFR